MKPTLLVLAAGMGSRYGGLKQLDQLGPSGETIMDYSIFDAHRAGFGKVVFVIRNSFEKEFRELFVNKLQGKIEVELVYQELEKIPAGIPFPAERVKPWGTGHAILMAEEVINEPFAVINADDFYGFEAYQAMAKFLVNTTQQGEFAMCGYLLEKTLSDFGSVSRGICTIDENGFLISVKERTSISKNQDGSIVFIEENKVNVLQPNDLVSMNFWGFTPDLFNHLNEKFVNFLHKNANIPKSEFYIPLVVDDLMQEQKVKTSVLKTEADWFGVTYQEDRPVTVAKIQKLVSEGKYPDRLW